MEPFEDGSAPSFYEILGIQRNSTDVEVRKAYKTLAKKWHPDKWSGETSSAELAKEKFQQIQEAYSVLSDGNKRAMYDAGVYDHEDDEDGFSEFLDEMASMMADVKDQNEGTDSLSELQNTFEKMLNENWFAMEGINGLKAKAMSESAKEKSDQSLLSRIDNFFCDDMDVEDEFWGEYDFKNATVLNS